MDPPPPTEVPGGVKEGGAGRAGSGSVLPTRAGFAAPETRGAGAGFWWAENLQSLARNCRHASSVLPDQIQKPEVMPTARLMKYFNMSTEKSG